MLQSALGDLSGPKKVGWSSTTVLHGALDSQIAPRRISLAVRTNLLPNLRDEALEDLSDDGTSVRDHHEQSRPLRGHS